MSIEPKTPKSDPLLGRSTPAIINHNLEWRTDEEFKKIHRYGKDEARMYVKEANERAAAKEAQLGYPKEAKPFDQDAADAAALKKMREAQAEKTDLASLAEEVGVEIVTTDQINRTQPERAHNEDGTFSADDPATPETNEAYKPDAQPVKEEKVDSEVANDLEEMHHKTFKKKYELTKEEYRAKHNPESIV